ncbi:helix-turn-helix domain-containing protein [Klebsiella pneumoniae]|uniref:helix-turn-helix domain-containing protein n=1 Tax=Klebsiella pneumoniae TaxID=573 RepID=UPI001330C03D|nr:helix-turn-helix domain-containing protein [Klebsiella pneumoniae]
MNSTLEKEVPAPKTKQQEAVMNRVHHLVAELVVKWSKDKSLGKVLNSSDTELARIIFESQIERNSEMSPRELRRIRALNEGTEKFSNRLKELGGTCRASVAADILGVKRQTVRNRQKANKLLSIKIGEETRFPIFQFDGNKITDGVEEILAELGDISDVTKISFFTGLKFFGDENINVIDALKKYGSDSSHMDVIRKQAALFGHQEAH